MNKFKLLLGTLVCLIVLSACVEDEDYIPNIPTTSEDVYFPSDLPSTINLSKDETSFNIPILRLNNIGEREVQILVTTTDKSGIFSVPNSVVFADGDSIANIIIGYDVERMSDGEYFDFEIWLKGNESTSYSEQTYTFSAGIPDPWKTLGNATFNDAFFFYDFYGVEIQQNIDNPNEFRLVKPYHEAFKVDDGGYWGGPWEGTDEYMQFMLLQPGSTIGGVSITQKDLVYFAPFCTGWNNPTYNDIVNVYHPITFTSMQDESYFTHNKVLSYQENGLPAVIQLAPFYYMDNTGGWNKTQEDGIITIIFPGVEIKDYSVGVEYAGRFTDPNGNPYADLNVTMGADVAYVKVGMAATEDINAVLEGILDGSIESVEMTADGIACFALGYAGKYTAIAISYDVAGTPQEAAYTQFDYTVGVATSAWTTLGMAKYTDDFIASLFNGVEPVTYNVEVQESEDSPGLYRLVNPYGEAFPYNESGDWDANKDYYLEINATDPQGVYIETQELGFDWGYGMFSASSYAYQYLANYDLETIKGAGYCGTLVDGVITFPTKTLLITATGLDGFYNANLNGAFKVELPSASKSSKSVKAMTSRMRADKKSLSGQRLKKMDRQLPKKFQMK